MFYKKRHYFDYNATSKISPRVLDWLKGELVFANPSSVHSSGKAVKREISQTKDFLFQTFELTEERFRLFFHSGASEGINTLLKGHAHFLKAQSRVMHLVYLATDHSCIHNLSEDLQREGHFVTKIEVNSNGDFEDQKLEESIRQAEGDVLVNYTWVNNETGVVHDLERIVKIKKATGCRVHVDAVQAVGKIDRWQNLSTALDAYTFSSHKFGSLKGTGYSFVGSELEVRPYVRGGGQQEGLRSGTENTLGILSTTLALEDVIANYDFEEQKQGKKYIETKLLELMGKKGEIAGWHHPHRNGNTIYFILYQTKAHTTSMALDMAGFDVSNGSACRSGAVLPSRVLRAMGYSDELAKSAIRLSFSHFFTREKAKEIWPSLQKVLAKFV